MDTAHAGPRYFPWEAREVEPGEWAVFDTAATSGCPIAENLDEETARLIASSPEANTMARKAKEVCSLFGTTHPQGLAELREAVFELRNLERAYFAKAQLCQHTWAYYDGALGYESRKCQSCGVDCNDLPKAEGRAVR